jgi:hypothetical protein
MNKSFAHSMGFTKFGFKRESISWSNINHQRNYWDWLAEVKNIQDILDWYNIKKSDVVDRNGSSFLHKYYKGSVFEALVVSYPQTEWQPWRFHSVPKNCWNNEDNRLKFFDWVADQMDFKDMESWYAINYDDIVWYGGK